MENQLINKKPSRTAKMVAYLRAFAAHIPEETFKGPDTLAEIFLKPEERASLVDPKIRAIIQEKEFSPGVYGYLRARTPLIDEIFKHALEKNIPQIVFLGAGYDTRTIRFKDQIDNTVVFEVDVHTTQNRKLKYLKSENISIPDQLYFVHTNFHSADLEDKLIHSGFKPSEETLFIWEGVTMYLKPDAIKSTLSFVHKYSARGSRIVFDYIYKKVLTGESKYFGATDALESVRKYGEPFQFGIEEGTIESFLRENNLELIKHYTPNDLEDLYLRDSQGNLLEQPYGFFCIVHARLN